jgi:pyrimidine deaminase RibD-like protein
MTRKPWHEERSICELAPYDARWIEYAARRAVLLTGRWRLVCVIVRGGRVLGVGTVRERNDVATCRETPWKSTEHAERAAIRSVKNTRGATAYVVRVGADGTLRHAQPCCRCQAAIEAAGLRAVWSSELQMAS